MAFAGRSSEDATDRERERFDLSSAATLTTITSPDEPKPSVGGDRRSAPQREREPREKDNKEDGVLFALCSVLYTLCSVLRQCRFLPSLSEPEAEAEAEVETAARKSCVA